MEKEWDSFWSGGHKKIFSEMEFNLRSHQGEITFNLLKKHRPQEKILEAGCGLGNWVFLFEGVGFDSYGVDISPVSLNRAAGYKESAGSKVKLLQADIRRLPFREKAFDIIVSYGAIEHFRDSLCALKDFFRVLNKGGACLVTTPNPFSFHRLLGRHLLNITRSRKLGYVGYEKAYTPGQLANMLKGAGFNRVEYGLLHNGMGYLFGEFWPAIPLVGKPIFAALVKIARMIEFRQKTVGGGSFAIGYK